MKEKDLGQGLWEGSRKVLEVFSVDPPGLLLP